MGAIIVRELQQNISASRNAGIRHARNDWIALLDHDDLWEADKIQHQLKLLDLYPAARVSGGETIIRIEENSFAGPPLPDQPEARRAANFYEYFSRIDADFFRHHKLHTSSWLIHREVFVNCGFFDERFPPQEDLEFIYRILARYGLGYVHLPLSQYRLHQTNTIHNSADKILQSHELFIEEIHRHPDKYIPGGKELVAEYLKYIFVSQNRLLAQKLVKKGDSR